MRNLGEINISLDIKVFLESVLIYCQSFNGILDEQCWKILPSIKILKNIRLKANRSPLLIIRLFRRNQQAWSNS